MENKKWIGTWGSSQLIAANETVPPAPGLANNTYRQAVRVSIGGECLKLKFTNEFGECPLEIESVHIARLLTPGVSRIDPATDTVVLFGGKESVTIPAGETVMSDVVSYRFDPLEYITVTTKFGNVPVTTTSHTASRSTNWLAVGNHVTDVEIFADATATSWYFLSDMETMADEDARAIVCFGDSITDGYGVTTDGYNRWTDQLARALQANPETKKVAVINRGIGGNAIWGGNGPAAKDRFERDVFGTTGAKYMILLIGVNDIGYAQEDISEAMFAQILDWTKQCHENGIKVYVGTVLPFKTHYYYSELHEQVRVNLNKRILAEGAPFDGVIDFASAIANEEDASKMKDVYANDYLHPSVPGYTLLGSMIDVKWFE